MDTIIRGLADKKTYIFEYFLALDFQLTCEETNQIKLLKSPHIR